MKKITELKNGIKFISHQLPSTHSVTVSINFRIGSLYENDSNRGITHLVEHLFFRRWDTLPQAVLYFKTLSMGTEVLAQTYHDFVRFSIKVVPEFFLSAFNLISMCFNSFDWNTDEINSEKAVVIKQIENSYTSYEKLENNCYFKGTNYEHAIMGSADTVKLFSPNAINLWKKTYFCCNNSSVILTGNFSLNDYLYVQKKLSEVNNRGTCLKAMICKPVNFCKRNYNKRYNILHSESDSSDITVFFDISSDYNYETVRLISGMLGEGCGSVLSMILRDKHFYTDEVYTDLTCYCGFYRLKISYIVKNNDFTKSLSDLFQSVSQFKKSISKKDYLSNIYFFTKNQLMDYDDQDSLNYKYALGDFVLSPLITEPNESKEKYEKITIDDLQKCAQKIFITNNISFLIQSSIDEITVKQSIEQIINRFL